VSVEAMTPGDAEKPRPTKPELRKATGPEAGEPGLRKATGAETVDLVSQVLKDAAQREEIRSRKAPVGRSRQRVAAVSLPLAGAFSFYLWFGQPAWVTPTLPDPVTTEAAEAGLRVGMYFQARRIEEFRNQNGRLPETLQELGGTPPAEMTYQRVDARTYRLVGQSRGVTLTFNSEEAIQQFVGDAMNRLGIGQGR
jgi:hypothetical protein